MILIAICDDDITVHDQLKEIIVAYSIINNEDISTISFFDSKELFASDAKYDILFLDIRFDQQDIGIDIAKQMRQNGNECVIILLTSLNSKAIEGYEIGAYRYIVKPIYKDKIFDVLNNALAKIRNSAKNVVIKCKKGSEIVLVNTILYIESIARKRFIHTILGSIETWESLKSIYEQLPKGQFDYTQKSFIINFAKITSIKKNDIILDGEISLPVSRQYKQSFFSRYFDYIGK